MAGSVGVKVTTSDDIFFEVDGKRIAGVQSYSTKYTNDVKTHDAFGSSIPIGFSSGAKKHTIDISRVYLEDTAIADGISFYNLADWDFNFVIIKDGNRITYKTCVISDISEDGQLKDKVAEKITIMALDRAEG
jgi:hypothetical protein